MFLIWAQNASERECQRVFLGMNIPVNLLLAFTRCFINNIVETFLQLSCEFRGVSMCLLFSSLVSVSCALHLALLYNPSHIITQPLKTMLESNREVCKVAFSCYNSDIIMSAMASQIAGVSIVCSTICSGAHQKKIEALRHWPLWGESTGDRWIPLTKG